MSIYLQLGGDRHVSIKLEFTLRNFKKNWRPFFFGPSPDEMPNSCWFGAFGLDVTLSKNSGEDDRDCHYEVVNDASHRAIIGKRSVIYDAYEINGDRWELIETWDKHGVRTKHRDGWLDSPEAKANAVRNQAAARSRIAERERAAGG